MQKLKKICGIVIFLLVIFIDTIVFADYKGVKYPNEDGTSWDDFMFYIQTKIDANEEEDLTDEELKRVMNASNDTEGEPFANRKNIDVAYLDTYKNKAQNIYNTRKAGGEDIESDEWEKARKEAIKYYEAGNKAKKEKDKISNWKKFQKKYKEMQKYDWKKTQKDNEINMYFSQVKKELEDRGEESENTEVEGEVTPEGELNEKIYIFKQPSVSDSSSSTTDSIDGLMGDSENFLDKGENNKIRDESIQDFSKTMYNILITIATFVAVLIGGILGVKIMIASADEKAQVKELLIPYVIGCVVVFGAFGIWKLVVTILQNM